MLRESVHVRAINLDAVVTDRTKTPVLDLEASDFHLRVDGQKVAVTGVSRGTELRETVAFSRALAEVRNSDPSPALLRHRQRQVSDEVTQMLRQLSQRGSVYRFGKVSQTSVLSRLRTYGAELARNTRGTISETGSLVDALAFVPGRKAVLYVSDGLPRSPLDLIAKTMYDRVGGGSPVLAGDDLVSATTSDGFNDPNSRPTGHDREGNTSMVRGVQQLDDGGAMAFELAVAELECGDAFDRLSALPTRTE